MQQRAVIGGFLLALGLIAITNPSLTGAAIGAPDANTVLLISLPLIALGAAVVANALKTIFLN